MKHPPVDDVAYYLPPVCKYAYTHDILTEAGIPSILEKDTRWQTHLYAHPLSYMFVMGFTGGVALISLVLLAPSFLALGLLSAAMCTVSSILVHYNNVIAPARDLKLRWSSPTANTQFLREVVQAQPSRIEQEFVAYGITERIMNANLIQKN